MRRLLITGAAGFIGSNFVYYWRNRHQSDEIIALDDLTYAGNKANLLTLINGGSIQFVKGSICNFDLVRDLVIENSINTIVHFAAESHVDRSIESPDQFIQTNVIGTHTLLKVARAAWLGEDGQKEHLFHHVSTDEVFGSLNDFDDAFTEQTSYAPNSPYAASKAASDHLVRAYHKTYGLNVTSSNCSNNYGPFQFPEKLIPLCLLNVLIGKPLPIYGDGRQTRDWLYVEDHCRAIELIIDEGQYGDSYNVGGNNELANIDVIKSLCEILNQKFSSNPELQKQYPNSPCSNNRPAESLINFVEDRLGHDRRYAIDARKISKELEFVPIESFGTGLNKTVDWYINNRDWWMAILDGTYRNKNLV
ncbi:MAG: dTDP-glucose 4,6-dehydratase [Gammaproteobacteria bacterium]|nr:dTDP-glucose 4,6-dehydratase [Gammaproteobacteria bacterium]